MCTTNDMIYNSPEEYTKYLESVKIATEDDEQFMLLLSFKDTGKYKIQIIINYYIGNAEKSLVAFSNEVIVLNINMLPSDLKE